MAGRWAVLAVLATAACGGGGSSLTGPTPVPETPAAVVLADGVTTQPVVGASFPERATRGSELRAEAAGYLTRRQVYDGGPVYLWPQGEEYVRLLVYNEFVPGRRLARWRRAFVVSGEVADPAVADALDQCSRATGLALSRGEGGAVTLAVDPTDRVFADVPGAAAATYLSFSGSEVVGARLVFLSADDLRWGVLHELGHVLGLGHSPGYRGVMWNEDEASGRRLTRFTSAELVALRMIYARREPGNAAPDVAPELASASGAPTRAVVAD